MRLMGAAACAWALAAMPVGAQVNAPAAPASGPVGSGHGEHTELIRKAHLSRLRERIETPAATLRETCRFESEIGSLPPRGAVALTFDDGPEPGQTELILEVLARHKAPATFFVIGEKAVRHPELMARIRELPGARVGAHSWSHPNFHHIGISAQEQEIDRSTALLEPTPGQLFRYPYGNSSCDGNAHLHGGGFRIVGWHVDSCDWAFDGDGQVNAHEALSCGVLPAYRHDFVGHVLSAVRAHRGGVVLLHEIHPGTLRQLDELLKRLAEEGFRFSSLDEPGWADSMR